MVYNLQHGFLYIACGPVNQSDGFLLIAILYGNSEEGAHDTFWDFWSIYGSCLDREYLLIHFFLPKRLFVLHILSTFSEIPSNINTMGLPAFILMLPPPDPSSRPRSISCSISGSTSMLKRCVALKFIVENYILYIITKMIFFSQLLI